MRALAALLVLSAPVAAQEPPPFDAAPLEACLARDAGGGGLPLDCIGLAADACMATGAGQTTLGMNLCLGAERDYWDGRLNAAYGEGMEAFPPVRRTALRDMQRAWIGFRDAACAFEAARYDGGSLAGTIRVGCQMRLTAEQALRLDAALAGDG